MSRKWPELCHISHASYIAAGAGEYRQEYGQHPDLLDVPCRVTRPRPSEVERAHTYQVQHMTPIFFPGGTGVRRHDRIDVIDSPVEEHIGRQYIVQTEAIPSQHGAVHTDCERIERV